MPREKHSSAESTTAESLAARIREHREKSGQFFEESSTRWKDLQERLVNELNVVVAKLDACELSYHQVEQRHLELQQEEKGLEVQRAELEQRACALDDQEIDIEAKRRQAKRELEQQQTDLRASDEEFSQQQVEEIEALERRVEELEKSVVSVESEKQSLLASLENQSSQFEQQFAELQQLVDSGALENQGLQEELERQNASRSRLETEYRSARDALVVSRNDEKQLRQQLAQSKILLNERAQQISSLREQLEDSLNNADVGKELAQELVHLQQQRDELQERLSDREHELQNHEGNSSQDDYQDLRRQFEMAVENIQSLQERNEELESRLASATVHSEANSNFDWETQKAKMLGELDTDQRIAPLNRLTIQKTIETTDQVVQERDKEIAMLRGRLEMASPDNDSRAQQVNEELDGDEIVQQERERLRVLQEEWREKLRAAEVEIAVERAENARVRAKLEEEMRKLECQARMIEKLETGKSSGRRWMDHLGLSDKSDG